MDSLGYGLGSITYEEILELLLTKKPYYHHLEQFLEQGFEEVSLINEIQRYFFTLFLFATHIKLYGNLSSEEVLGYKLPQALLEKKKISLSALINPNTKTYFIISINGVKNPLKA